MKKIVVICFVSILPFLAFSQNVFKGKKLNYSFTIPAGWYMKNEMYSASTDGKVIDGKGNSFIVTIQNASVPNSQTAVEYFGTKSSIELESLFSQSDNKVKILARNTVVIDGKAFYYIYTMTTYTDGFKTYDKSYSYNLKTYSIVLNACCLEKYINETKSIFAQIISSFKF